MVTIKSGLSPNVRTQETDISDFVNNTSSTITLLIGNTTIGPAFKINIVTNEKEFADTYGTPTDETAKTFFAASGYFARGSNLIFTRIVDRPTAKVAAIGYRINASDAFPTVADLDPILYSNDPSVYSEASSESTIITQDDVESYYGKVYNGVETFVTRHSKNRAYPRVRDTLYDVGDLVHDGWYDTSSGSSVETFNGQTTTNQGTWDASTDTAPSVSPSDGDYYVVSVGGTTTFGVDNTWVAGDIIIYDSDYLNDSETAYGNWRKLTGTLRPNGYVYRCITAGLASSSFNDSDELAQAIDNEIVSGGDTLSWSTTVGTTTTDGEVVWERIVWTEETLYGGIKYQNTISGTKTDYDPDDTATWTYSVTINNDSKANDLIISALGPGEAYNDYYVFILGYKDSEQLKKYSYSLSIPRAFMRSNSPIPVADATFGDSNIRHFLSKVKYSEFVSKYGFIANLPGDLPTSSSEFGIFVLAKDRETSSYSTVEYFRVSTVKNSTNGNGLPLFVEDVINSDSNIIRAKLATTAIGKEFSTTTPISLYGGYIGDLETFDETVTDPNRNNGAETTLIPELVHACDLYRDVEIDIDLIIDGDKPVGAKKELAQLAEDLNGEAFAILDVPEAYSDPLDIANWTNEILLLNTSYAGIYHNRFKIYDKYNGIYRWVSGSGIITGMIVRNDRNNFPWIPPAGTERAVLNDVVDIREKMRSTSRDILYANRVNPVCIVNNAVTVFGQKTLLDKTSYLNRINVRRLINYMKRNTRRVAQQFLFQYNDATTRLNATNIMTSFCANIERNNGIQEFLVVCNETNNPEQVRNNSEMYIDIYVKPEISIELIWLRYYITRSGINLQELSTRNV
jgi:hypothetical protein